MRRLPSTRSHRTLTCLTVGIGLAANLLPIVTPVTRADEEPSTVAEAPALHWHENYGEAYASAQRDGRMLFINFVPRQRLERAQKELEQVTANDATLRARFQTMTLARLPEDLQIEVEQKKVRLLDHPAFRDLGGPGVAMLDLRDQNAPHYGRMVTALPFVDGKYYRWQPAQLGVALDLPAGTISQRTMVWAVRVHHEQPASTTGEQHAALAEAAAEQSAYQARIGVQGHHRWEVRVPRLRAATRALRASEVVAESWPDESLIDACIDCVASWRQSPGHWDAVRSRHRVFGYDICRGKNGIWYGTGIFAN